MDISVTGHVRCWHAMCETKCHVDLSHEATSRIPHLLFFVSCYLISWYQQSPYLIIVLHVPCTVLVPDTLYSLNKINITWRWRRLDGRLGHIGWMSWIHYASHYRGWGSAGYPLYIAHWAPVSRFSLLVRLSELTLVSAARKLFKTVILGIHIIHSPDKSTLTLGFSINIIK